MQLVFQKKKRRRREKHLDDKDDGRWNSPSRSQIMATSKTTRVKWSYFSLKEWNTTAPSQPHTLSLFIQSAVETLQTLIPKPTVKPWGDKREGAQTSHAFCYVCDKRHEMETGDHHTMRLYFPILNLMWCESDVTTRKISNLIQIIII